MLIVVRADKSVWALVGSANVTYQGLFANQEVCVEFDSHIEGDRPAIESLEQWFRIVLKTGHVPDLESAKEIFDARSEYRLERRPKAATASGYWILKTTSGSDGMEHWPEFESG
ncbi:MAG TPA: hypothetical protein VHE81_20575, partial [Lacipirellulaceae bacterium]|nr:hypothetical protein [Lacipirellulaceae bacterium]